MTDWSVAPQQRASLERIAQQIAQRVGGAIAGTPLAGRIGFCLILQRALPRWTHSKLDVAWRSACKRVGVEIGLYNGTMHSTLAALRAAGVPLADLQEIRGHGYIETTRGYAPLDPARMRELLLRRTEP